MKPLTLPTRPSDAVIGGQASPSPAPDAQQPVPAVAPAASQAKEESPVEPAADKPEQKSEDSGSSIKMIFTSKEITEIKSLVSDLKATVEEIRNKPDVEIPEQKETDLSPVLDAISKLSSRIEALESKEPEKQDAYDDKALVGMIKKLDAKVSALGQIIASDTKEDKKDVAEDSVEAVRDSSGKIVKVVTKKDGKVSEKQVRRDNLGRVVK
jgi:hypothetical protein